MQDYRLDDVCEQVKAAIFESLDSESRDVSLSDNLVRDLGAESLDFLDIVFRLEKRFGIKIERGSIEKSLRARFPELNVKPNTPVTDDIRAALKELLPEVPEQEIAELTKMKEIARTFRIATFVRLTVQGLAQRGAIQVEASVGRDGYSAQQLGVVAG